MNPNIEGTKTQNNIKIKCFQNCNAAQFTEQKIIWKWHMNTKCECENANLHNNAII